MFKKIALFCVVFALKISCFAQLLRPAAGEPLKYNDCPFWKMKQKARKKVQENQSILVSVKSRQQQDKRHLLTMVGGGQIKTPVKFAYDQSKKLGELKDYSEYIVASKWNPELRTLYLHTVAFKYHAIMRLSVDFFESEDFYEIRWKHDQGVFKGLRGVIRFSHKDAKTSEIGLQTEYFYQDLKIPKFFVEFGLEVALHRVASRIRAVVEKKFKQSL